MVTLVRTRSAILKRSSSVFPLRKFYPESGFILRCFRDPIRVPIIRKIGFLQVHNKYLTFLLKITLPRANACLSEHATVQP